MPGNRSFSGAAVAAAAGFYLSSLLAAGPLTAAAPSQPPQQTAAQRHLARGDRAHAAGHWRRARHAWLRAARLETADGAAARERLLNQLHQEAARHWFRAHSEHFILLAPPHAPVARHAEDFLRRREASLRTLVERLGQTPDGPITIYVYNSSRQAWKLLGRPIGFADPARREIHVRADQEPGHEETHIIAWTWNHRGCGVPFLEEGLAVSLSTHPGSPGAGAAAVLARGVMPDLADLVTRFHDFRYGYVLAGSFVSNLLEHNGMEAVRKLYSGRPDEFIPGLEQETGKKLAWLQAAWETELAAQGTASREPIIMALSLLRLDHLDEALNLLEEQHSVEPDNPAVEFALAHALKENGDLEAASGVYRRMLRLHLPYHLAWMKKRARQALLELEARPFPGSETESQP